MTTKACKKSGRPHTEITSRKQQKAMGAALSAKQGKTSKSSLRGAAKQMAGSMSADELERHLKESKGKKLPRYVSHGERVYHEITGRRR